MEVEMKLTQFATIVPGRYCEDAFTDSRLYRERARVRQHPRPEP